MPCFTPGAWWRILQSSSSVLLVQLVHQVGQQVSAWRMVMLVLLFLLAALLLFIVQEPGVCCPLCDAVRVCE